MITPDLVHKDFARKHVSSSEHQLMQQIEFFGCQLNTMVSHETLPPVGIDLNVPEP
jgi:hypothetical protein